MYRHHRAQQDRERVAEDRAQRADFCELRNALVAQLWRIRLPTWPRWTGRRSESARWEIRAARIVAEAEYQALEFLESATPIAELLGDIRAACVEEDHRQSQTSSVEAQPTASLTAMSG